uniref:Uncharacterized protein n=1 Tax=Palpitomonas bilix TaxID=652834 RepID=A0A7S3G5C0_9EUKA
MTFDKEEEKESREVRKEEKEQELEEEMEREEKRAKRNDASTPRQNEDDACDTEGSTYEEMIAELMGATNQWPEAEIRRLWRDVFPAPIISLVERKMIRAKLQEWTERLEQSGAELDTLTSKMIKPLRCMWVNQSSRIEESEVQAWKHLPFTPILCVSASSHLLAGRPLQGENVYFQGAGDDEESWAMGLAPEAFWQNKDRLLRSETREECAGAITDIVKHQQVTSIGGRGVVSSQQYSTTQKSGTLLDSLGIIAVDGGYDPLFPGMQVVFSNVSMLEGMPTQTECHAVEGAKVRSTVEVEKEVVRWKEIVLHDHNLSIKDHGGEAWEKMEVMSDVVQEFVHSSVHTPLKGCSVWVSMLAKNSAKTGLLRSLPFILLVLLTRMKEGDSSIRIACPTGGAESIGVLLSLISAVLLTPSGQWINHEDIELLLADMDKLKDQARRVSKQTVTLALQRLQESIPNATPPRRVLKQVNSFFMSTVSRVGACQTEVN